MSIKNFRAFVIHSRNQLLGGIAVEMLDAYVLGPIERTFLFIRQPREQNILKGLRENYCVKVSRTKS